MTDRIWLIRYHDNTIQQVLAPSEPGPETGYDLSIISEIKEVTRVGNLFTELRNEADDDWVTDIEKLKLAVIENINCEREKRCLLAMTTGEGKNIAYSQKIVEVKEYSNLETAFENLSEEDKESKFRFAYNQMKLTGQSISEVIDEFKAGASKSMNEIARLEAICRAAILAVQAAQTCQEVNADIDWGWGT